MTELKCPVCDSYLHKIPVKEAWVCGTHDSKDELYGTKELWQALIDTKKKLDLAITELKNVVEDDDFDIYMRQLSAQTTLEQINEIKGGK